MSSFGFIQSQFSLEEIGEQLMEEVKKSGTSRISDELLSLLNFIFQGPLLPALELVENQSVTRISSPSGRELIQIIGASGTPYTCFPNLKYCSCPAYHYSVLCREDYIMCKHVLAMKLSMAMGLTKTLQVSDAEITNMIITME